MSAMMVMVMGIDGSRHGVASCHSTDMLKWGRRRSIGQLELIVGNMVIERASTRGRLSCGILIGGMRRLQL